jgi:hypothetical protein
MRIDGLDINHGFWGKHDIFPFAEPGHELAERLPNHT